MSSDIDFVPELVKIIQVNHPTSIMDVGAGYGSKACLIRLYCEEVTYIKSKWKMTIDAIEIFKPYLNETSNFYNTVIYGDCREINIEGYDLVLILDVLEHFKNKNNALEFLKKLNSLNKSIIATTPLGFRKQGVVHGNVYQKHHLGFDLDDFKVSGLNAKIDKNKIIVMSKNLRSDYPLIGRTRRKIIPLKIRKILLKIWRH